MQIKKRRNQTRMLFCQQAKCRCHSTLLLRQRTQREMPISAKRTHSDNRVQKMNLSCPKHDIATDLETCDFTSFVKIWLKLGSKVRGHVSVL